MATAKKDASLKDAQETFNALMLGQQTGVTYEQAFDMLADAPDAALKELSSEYFKFDQVGKSYNFVAEGLDTFQDKDGKDVEVVKLRDRDGNTFVNGDKVLVSAVKKLTTVPAFIKVTYLRDAQSARGTYKELSVKTFPL